MQVTQKPRRAKARQESFLELNMVSIHVALLWPEHTTCKKLMETSSARASGCPQHEAL